MKTIEEIREALKSNTFNVYMKTAPGGLGVYRVIAARVKDGDLQVKTPCSRARRGYLWWTVTPIMEIYTN